MKLLHISFAHLSLAMVLVNATGCSLTKFDSQEGEPSPASDLQSRENFASGTFIDYARHVEAADYRKVNFAANTALSPPSSTGLPNANRGILVQGLSETHELVVESDRLTVAMDSGERDNNSNNFYEKELSRQVRSGKPTLDIDDQRPDDQFNISVLGRPLTIGGEYGINPSFEKDFELDREEQDDIFDVGQSLSLEFFYPWSDSIQMFFEVGASYSADVYAEDGKLKSDLRIRRKQSWLYFDRLWESNFAFQIGKQKINDKREWWWDDDLDAIRIHYLGDKFEAEVALAQELASEGTNDDGIDPEQEEVLRLFGRARWKWADKQRIEFFYLNHNDHSRTERSGDIIQKKREDEFDANLQWIGLRSMGRFKIKTKIADTKIKLGKFQYWIDTGYVWGKETVIDFDGLSNRNLRITDDSERIRVEGWAVDVGLTWQLKYLPLPFVPSLTVGYAIGSGDDSPDSGDDHSFRQTGLQGNNWRFRGVDSFRYYGELLDPELSNIQIWTVSLGIPLFSNSSIEILYHKYDQVELADFLRDASIDADPTGENRDIGQEWDIVIGLEEWDQLELEFTAGVFIAGDAYGDFSGRTASIYKLKINYNF